MGNFIAALFSFFFADANPLTESRRDKCVYAIFDPNQIQKPHGRSKDLISSKHRDNPNRLDRCVHPGCDTIWKCFKRSVWLHPDKPFLGVRTRSKRSFLGLPSNDEDDEGFGPYEWKSWSEIDIIVENLSRVFVKRCFCPIVKSDVEGTPDLKFIGIFSENRLEWYTTEIAACSDSICIVPVAVQQQFMSEERISKILNDTELVTLCVSKATIKIILDLKSKDKLRKLHNLIMFDKPDEV